MAAPAAEVFTTPEVLTLTGLSPRRLDYWTRLGVLDPVAPDFVRTPGSGSRRAWRLEHVHALRVLGRVADCFTDENDPAPPPGVPTSTLARVVETLRRHGWPTTGWLLVCGDAAEWCPDAAAAVHVLETGQPWLVLALLATDRP